MTDKGLVSRTSKQLMWLHVITTNNPKLSPHTSPNGHYEKKNPHFWRGVDKREPSYIVGGNVNWCCTMKNSLEVLQKKLKIEMPYYPATWFLGTYPEKIIIWKDICIPGASSPPWDLPYSESKSMSLTSPALADKLFTTSAIWEALLCLQYNPIHKMNAQSPLNLREYISRLDDWNCR